VLRAKINSNINLPDASLLNGLLKQEKKQLMISEILPIINLKSIPELK
jgi:hypothetical protein